MSKAYDFLKECGVFFMLTVNGDYPAGRPFGVVSEIGDTLYITTNDRNRAHGQLRANGHVQLIAKKADTREWIRITGTAAECTDMALKERVHAENPRLQAIHPSPHSEHFLVFAIDVENVEFN